MRDGDARPTIDPTLAAELAAAAADGRDVEAIFVLRVADPAQDFPDPETTQAQAELLVNRVTRATGETPRFFNVFKYLGSFLIVASPSFVRTLLEQEEVAAATANRQG